MTLFWILAGTLSLAVIAAVLLPLWRVPQSHETTLLELNRRVFAERLAELEEDRDAGRIDPDTFADLKTELQRNLLSVDLAELPVRNERLWRTPVALAFLASALSVFFYAVVVFTPDVPQWWQVRASASPAAERLMQGKLPSDSDSQAQSLQEIIQGMQYQLQRNPQQPEGWFTLGVAYAQAEMLPPALVAFERAWRLKPEETRYALTLAQARLFSNQGRLDDFSRKLLATVVQREPSHEGALLLLGLGAWRSGDAATAVPALEQLVKARQEHAANDNSPAMQEVAKALADARAQLSSGPAAASARRGAKLRRDPRRDPPGRGRHLAAGQQPAEERTPHGRKPAGHALPLGRQFTLWGGLFRSRAAGLPRLRARLPRRQRHADADGPRASARTGVDAGRPDLLEGPRGNGGEPRRADPRQWQHDVGGL